MKSSKLQQKVIELLMTKKEMTPKEILQNLQDDTTILQIRDVLKILVLEQVLELREENNRKYYSLRRTLKFKVQYNNLNPVKIDIPEC